MTMGQWVTMGHDGSIYSVDTIILFTVIVTMGHDGSMGHDRSMGQDGSWVTMGQWVMGQWVMGHVYDGSDGSWTTKSDPWSTLMYSMEKWSYVGGSKLCGKLLPG